MDPATSGIVTTGHTLSRHDALPISRLGAEGRGGDGGQARTAAAVRAPEGRRGGAWRDERTGEGCVMSEADDTPWREAMRVPRLGNLDARAFYAFLLFLFYWSWWTLGFCVLVVIVLWVVERFGMRSEEHTSELQSLMRNSYA